MIKVVFPKESKYVKFFEEVKDVDENLALKPYVEFRYKGARAACNVLIARRRSPPLTSKMASTPYPTTSLSPESRYDADRCLGPP